MPINITMPALSPTMEEGNLAKWLVKEGDKIKSGNIIAEIETDKATMEVEAVDEGVIAKILVAAGSEGVKVNTVIAVLAVDGEDVATAASGTPAAPAPQAVAPTSPLAGEDAAKRQERGNDSTPTKSPLSVAKEGDISPARGENKEGRTFASPLARRIAKDAGVSIAAITGSGPHGRVVKADVDAAIAGGALSSTSPLRGGRTEGAGGGSVAPFTPPPAAARRPSPQGGG